VETPDEMREALKLRREIFVDEQGIPSELDEDGCDEDATLVLIYDGNVPVATGRFSMGAVGEATLARIAVRPRYRGHGIGGLVVSELEKLATLEGARRFVLLPHEYLEDFYEKLGYRKTTDAGTVGRHRLIAMEKEVECGR
jgi:predicted GNAT family N-acyltransferase